MEIRWTFSVERAKLLRRKNGRATEMLTGIFWVTYVSDSNDSKK